MDFKAVLHVANEFDVSDDSVQRHAAYFGLDEESAGDTEK